jgi:V/A-type H+-transporting ATPase subunit E
MSENTLDGLIAKIKSEGIDLAEQEAKQIVEQAKQKAQSLLEAAELQKNDMLTQAQSEAEAIVNKGKIALNQAARDVEIKVKNDILKLFEKVLETEVSKSFTPDLYPTLIKDLVGQLGGNLSISIPEGLEKKVMEAIQSSLSDEQTRATVLKSADLSSGFSISSSDEGWSFDVTPEEISTMLSEQLSSKWVQLLNKE